MHLVRESGDDDKGHDQAFYESRGEPPTATVASSQGKAAGKKPTSFSSGLFTSLGNALSPTLLFYRQQSFSKCWKIRNSFLDAQHPYCPGVLDALFGET
jgi:hypothetical protein